MDDLSRMVKKQNGTFITRSRPYGMYPNVLSKVSANEVSPSEEFPGHESPEEKTDAVPNALKCETYEGKTNDPDEMPPPDSFPDARTVSAIPASPLCLPPVPVPERHPAVPPGNLRHTDIPSAGPASSHSETENTMPKIRLRRPPRRLYNLMSLIGGAAVLLSSAVEFSYRASTGEDFALYEAAYHEEAYPLRISEINSLIANFSDMPGRAVKKGEIDFPIVKSFPITARDLSADTLYQLHNETPYRPDLTALMAAQTSSASDITRIDPSLPQVLIVHTHGTEAFSSNGYRYTEEEAGFRSNDITRNIVAVGSVMAQVLNDYGIGVIHCETMHDEESYLKSYTRSYETVRDYLTQYPSIRYVLDVHRDAIIDSAGNCTKPICVIDGKTCAQVMTVVGTDYGGANHPDWQTNLALACRLQSALSDISPSLCRPINLRSAAFNQKLSPGMLLIEVGSCGNTLEEAQNAAYYTALALCHLIAGEKM